MHPKLKLSPFISEIEVSHKINNFSFFFFFMNKTILFLKFRVLMDGLQKVDLRFLSHQQKLAFWINMYNACIMHVNNLFSFFSCIKEFTYVYLKTLIAMNLSLIDSWIQGYLQYGVPSVLNHDTLLGLINKVNLITNSCTFLSLILPRTKQSCNISIRQLST